MGFLDKLLGRKTKPDAAEGMHTAPPPPTMPTGEPPEHTHGEGEHTHEPEGEHTHETEDEPSPGAS
jgi:hypothetical protein